ncbi:hypothetical protein BSKO_05352 [Bryopsis sp. KO-2023]|nr:hypothetical protein BSKO_05352 [Bryopsis sp. KO-2023]
MSRVWSVGTVVLLAACLGVAYGQVAVKDLKQNIACTWTDKLGCFLDYFALMPESQIKDFYKKDEECSFLKSSKKCVKDNNCEWFDMTAGDGKPAGDCLAKISKEELEECAATENPKPGSLCGVFQIQDACGRARKKKKCKNAGCEWEEGSRCVPSPKVVATMEFLGKEKAAKVVLDTQLKCLDYLTREECEGTALNS